MLNKKQHARWLKDNGDFTHNLNYNLNSDSKVMELGGYTGEWVNNIITKYNPNIYIIEPIEPFYNGMVNKFKRNKKVHLLNVAIGVENKNGVLYLNNDMTSSLVTKNKKLVEVEFLNMSTILEKFGVTEIDLLQINIEGGEYDILEDMIISGVINNFKNIQIQFHLDVSNAKEKRDKIQKKLITNGFQIKFNYDFVWEGWTKINNNEK
jgi:FkbM family methyltransferase